MCNLARLTSPACFFSSRCIFCAISLQILTPIAHKGCLVRVLVSLISLHEEGIFNCNHFLETILFSDKRKGIKWHANNSASQTFLSSHLTSLTCCRFYPFLFLAQHDLIAKICIAVANPISI